MRVEAIVKKDGLFIPHPGITFGKQKHILLDITPVSTDDVSEDAFVQAAGMLKKTTVDGDALQKLFASAPKFKISKRIKIDKLMNEINNALP